MTAGERARVIQRLKESEQEFYASIATVNDEQWNWTPALDRWSVGQTADHIVQAEVVIFRRLEMAIQSPANPEWDVKTSGKIEVLERVMLDRSQKATAPETTRPKGVSKEEAVRRFKQQRAQIIRFAEETRIPLKEHVADHPFPVFSTLNAYQWLSLVALHQLRHQQQIAEIMASPGYPK